MDAPPRSGLLRTRVAAQLHPDANNDATRGTGTEGALPAGLPASDYRQTPLSDSCRKIRYRGSDDVRRRSNSPCTRSAAASILNHMVQYPPSHLNASFAALADATRRGVLDQLARGDASISDLADRFRLTLTGMKKHVGVLELAGLVTTEKVGRVRTCRIGPCRLEEELEWIARYRQVWDARFEALDEVIDDLKRQEKASGRRKGK